MNTAKVSENMMEFESLFEDIDVRTAIMDDAIDGVDASQIPEDDVSSLMQEVADEHQLDVADMMPTAPIGKEKVADGPVGGLDQAGENDLEERLARLRQET